MKTGRDLVVEGDSAGKEGHAAKKCQWVGLKGWLFVVEQGWTKDQRVISLGWRTDKVRLRNFGMFFSGQS